MKSYLSLKNGMIRIYRESCIIEYLDFYYDNNDFSNFLKYTKLIFELESQKIYERYVPQWQDFMTKDSIISVLEKPIDHLKVGIAIFFQDHFNL